MTNFEIFSRIYDDELVNFLSPFAEYLSQNFAIRGLHFSKQFVHTINFGQHLYFYSIDSSCYSCNDMIAHLNSK